MFNYLYLEPQLLGTIITFLINEHNVFILHNVDEANFFFYISKSVTNINKYKRYNYSYLCLNFVYKYFVVILSCLKKSKRVGCFQISENKYSAIKYNQGKNWHKRQKNGHKLFIFLYNKHNWNEKKSFCIIWNILSKTYDKVGNNSACCILKW